MIARMVIFSVLGVILIATLPTPAMLAAAAGGLALGVGAAFYGFSRAQVRLGSSVARGLVLGHHGIAVSERELDGGIESTAWVNCECVATHSMGFSSAAC